MSWLTAGELADLRDHFDDTLPGTCVIEYVTNSTTGMGANSPTWTGRGTVSCRLYPATGRAAAMFGLTAEQISERRFWNLALAYDQTIEVTDRVTIGSTTYQVVQHTGGESEAMLKFALLEVAQ